MATPPPLDPDEVGYTSKPAYNGQRESHTPETCTAEHCSCHLPLIFMPPELKLTGREALVLAWHLFPLGEDTDLTFEEIGKKLGVMPAQARRIYMKAGAKLRAYPRDHYPPKPGTPEYEEYMARAKEYRAAHPEYAANRALIHAMDENEGMEPTDS